MAAHFLHRRAMHAAICQSHMAFLKGSQQWVSCPGGGEASDVIQRAASCLSVRLLLRTCAGADAHRLGWRSRRHSGARLSDFAFVNDMMLTTCTLRPLKSQCFSTNWRTSGRQAGAGERRGGKDDALDQRQAHRARHAHKTAAQSRLIQRYRRYAINNASGSAGTAARMTMSSSAQRQE
eukprot:GHVT01016131.1.p1 GENE.GHVT01016131.1~~GHVT01016131.1.p1  ORF type:complete len:179 (+),score=18.66 GHVT01016131.1:329-865(+)